jgi:hypothetical protein
MEMRSMWDPRAQEAVNKGVLFASARDPMHLGEAASYLGIAVQRLLALAEDDTIPAYRYGPDFCDVLFRHEDLLEIGGRLWREDQARIAAEAERFARTSVVGWVYFVEAAEVRRIKIGHSGEPGGRKKGLLTGSPVDLETIGVLRGTKPIEWAIQDGFAATCWKREWFHDTPRLRAFMAEFVSPPSAVEAIKTLEMRNKDAETYLSAIATTIESWFAANP